MKHLLVAVTACAALALTGCGSDDSKDSDKDTTSEPTKDQALTKEEFVTQANAICKAGTETMEAAEAGAFADPENPTEAELEAAVNNVMVPALKKQVDEIGELAPPAEDADTVEAMLDSLEADIAKAEADWSYIGEDEAFADATAKALELGLTECGAE